MAKSNKPGFLLYGFLFLGLLVAVCCWWLASLIFSEEHSGKPASAIIGMSANNLINSLEGKGFRVEKDLSSDKAICKKGRHQVEVYGLERDATMVRLTIQPLFRTDGVLFDQADALLSGLIASTPYNGAKASVNNDWARNNFDKNSTTDDGVAAMETKATDSIRILLIRPSYGTIKSL